MGRLLPGLLVATLLAVGPVRAAEQPPVNDPAGEGEVMDWLDQVHDQGCVAGDTQGGGAVASAQFGADRADGGALGGQVVQRGHVRSFRGCIRRDHFRPGQLFRLGCPQWCRDQQ